MEDDIRNKMIGVKLTESEFDALNEICKARQITKSVFIRELISDYLWK